MNELETQLSKILEKALNVAEKTGDFAIEQAPLLLQEFYRWHITESILTIVICIIFFILFSRVQYLWTFKELPLNADERYYTLKGKRYYKKDYTYDILHPGLFASILIKVVSYSLISCFLLPSIYKLFFILTSPKLYLIEYFIK